MSTRSLDSKRFLSILPWVSSFFLIGMIQLFVVLLAVVSLVFYKKPLHCFACFRCWHLSWLSLSSCVQLVFHCRQTLVEYYPHDSGEDQGGGGLGGQPSPAFWGNPEHHEEGKKRYAHVGEYILVHVLNSYSPSPHFPKILYPPLTSVITGSFVFFCFF